MYENLIKAISSGRVPDESGLSYEAKARNYEIFSRLMKEGVDLQNLIDCANAKKEPSMDESLFAAMEASVSSVPAVKDAKKAKGDALKRVIERLASDDPAYRKADSEYRDAVMKAYMDSKKEGTPTPVKRDDGAE